MRKKPVLFLSLLLLAFQIQPAYGWMIYSVDAVADSSLLGNSFVDILYHDGILWLAGGKGLSGSDNQGETWVTYTADTTEFGLNSNNPSAIFGRPGQIWVAGSHFEAFQGFNYPFGDGFNMSTDGGGSWQSFTPSEASNFGKLAYDIAGTDSSTYAACFHGGLIVSHDFGENWTHLFYSPLDSLDWIANEWADSASGRFYSCVVDTFHEDTLVLLAGAAKGVYKFIYLPKRVKLGGDRIYDIISDDSTVYLAHEGGVTRTVDSIITPLFTVDTADGLGANLVRKLAVFDGKLWACVFNPEDSNGAGLYYSTDSAETWDKVSVDYFNGPGAGVFDIKLYHDSAFYVAAGDSGVFRSVDSGQSWVRFFVDSMNLDLDSACNQVYSIDLTGDTLYLGTKAGLVKAPYINEPFTIDDANDTLITFPESDTSGSFVSLVRHTDGDFITPEEDTIHYCFTWVGVEPQTGSGSYAGILIDSLGNDSTAIFAKVNDIVVKDPITSIIATRYGLSLSSNGLVGFPSFNFSVVDPTKGLTLNSYEFLTADYVGDRLYTGTSAGFAYMITNNEWRVFKANTDPKKHDLAVARRHSNSGLPGDWVVALDIQVTDADTILWAACRRVPDTVEQENAIAFSADFGTTWQEALPDLQVWNFAFHNGIAYAAASEGLYYASSPWDNWTRVDIIDPVTLDTVIAGTEVYSVEVADTILWVGTELGLAMRHVDSLNNWTVIRNYKSTEAKDEVFAAPVPFSPINNNGRLSLHYHVENSADVTVEIYDFAMNLVRVVAENRPRAGDADYFETWDGYNGNGDMVATGIYYFKVSYSTGEKYWGRLAIVP